MKKKIKRGLILGAMLLALTGAVVYGGGNIIDPPWAINSTIIRNL